MDNRTRIKVADVKKVGELARQQPAPAHEEVSRQGAVLMIAEDLFAMHEQGHTWPKIARWLGEQGIPITAHALQQVLRRARAKSKERAPAPTRTHATPTSATGAQRAPAGRPPKMARGGEGRAIAPPTSAATTASASTQPAAVRRPESTGGAPLPGTFVIRPDTPDL